MNQNRNDLIDSACIIDEQENFEFVVGHFSSNFDST